MMPEPMPLATDRKIETPMYHATFASRSCVKARTANPVPRPSIDGMALHIRPNRSMIWPLA